MLVSKDMTIFQNSEVYNFVKILMGQCDYIIEFRKSLRNWSVWGNQQYIHDNQTDWLLAY